MKKFGMPSYVYACCVKLTPWLAVSCAMLLAYGLYAGLYVAPVDYQQKQAVKLMYVHVPCAILSLGVYTIIGLFSAIYLIWKPKIADLLAKVSAPIGASFTALALISGALWGKPMWGTWWVWDARLTSELVLLFLYFGYMGLRSAIPDRQIAATSCAILAVVGLIDIPIVHFSVEWWHTLHQGASISKFAKPDIALPMLWPLLSMLAACYLFYLLMLSINLRTEILWRERHSSWVRNVLLGNSVHG